MAPPGIGLLLRGHDRRAQLTRASAEPKLSGEVERSEVTIDALIRCESKDTLRNKRRAEIGYDHLKPDSRSGHRPVSLSNHILRDGASFAEERRWQSMTDLIANDDERP